jgi:DNA-directed RNA polymerase subunit RPC12/RpoP
MSSISLQDNGPIKAPGTGSVKACPKCGSARRMQRIPRALWMRIFPHSLNMECGQCSHRFWRIS